MLTSRDHTAALDRDRHRRVKAERSISRLWSTAKNHECLRSGALNLCRRLGIMAGLLVALAVDSAPLAIARPTTPKPPTTIGMPPTPAPEATTVMAPAAENAGPFVAPISIAGVDTVIVRVSADAVLTP